MLEVVFRAYSELVFASIFLGHLQDTVAPVVCAFRVFGVVHSEISDNIRVFEVSSAFTGTVSNQTMAKIRFFTIYINYALVQVINTYKFSFTKVVSSSTVLPSKVTVDFSNLLLNCGARISTIALLEEKFSISVNSQSKNQIGSELRLSVLLQNIGGARVSETKLLPELIGVLQKYSFQSTIFRKESYDAGFLNFGEVFEVGPLGEILGGWASLGFHELSNTSYARQYK